MSAYIACHRIVKVYRVGGHELVALRGIDFEMAQGEFVAIIGPSGAGKSSLLNLLGGLDTPTAGQLIVAGQNLLDLKGRALADYRLHRVGFLWQQVSRNLLTHRSALRNVTLPLMLAGVPFWQRSARARELLDAVGLADHVHKKPEALSGGQQQRVGLAVALANRPPLLLADEPTGALDRTSGAQMLDLLADLRQRYGLTILMVTHDLEISAYADRVLTLRDGALGQDLSRVEDAPTLDEVGRLRLPEAVRAQLGDTPRLAVEIRPEGVLLRPESDAEDDTGFADFVPQDTPPERKHGLFRRRS
ncbi:MAG TPA: ABC transporter ATP-binding protein [Phototrophicaceae bacterium]|nr:ABC transporter ATP-binding protein [Phototrophicaceae bacterium]